MALSFKHTIAYSSLIAALAFLTFSSGCNEDSFTQVLDVELPEHTPALAVGCRITEGDDILRVFVSHSLGILDTGKYKIIQNAHVILKHNNSVISECHYDPTSGYYLDTLIPPITFDGGEYRLEVQSPDFEPAYAVQPVPTFVVIDTMEFKEDGAILADGERGHQVNVSWTDPGDEVNYYSLDIYTSTNTGGGEPILQMRYLEFLDPTIEYGFDTEALLDDVSFNGTQYTARVAFDNYSGGFLQPGGKVYAVLRCLSHDAFLYSRSRELYFLAIDNPFAEPVIVHSNITGGYGIFSLNRPDTMSIGF